METRSTEAEQATVHKVSYTYDNQGSLLQETGTDYCKKYMYNDLRQTIAVEVIRGREAEAEHLIQENIYDAEGMRHAIVENGVRTNFIHNGWSNFVELDEENKVKKRLIRGIGVVASEEDGAYHYYHGNERGDIEYVTNQNGGIANSYEYDAFGRITKSEESIANRYTYNGEAYDNVTEQYYLRARYYNPKLSRFTQEDVYRGDGLNLYAFCGHNPVRYVDPSGYDSTLSEIVIPQPGDVDFIGPVRKGWRLVPNGEGAHLVERANVRGRSELACYDMKNTPRYYPYGTPESAGYAHMRLHRATKAVGVDLQGGNPNMSSDILMELYMKGYSSSDLDGIRGDLRTKDGRIVIAENVTPKEAFVKLQEWGEIQQENKNSKCSS